MKKIFLFVSLLAAVESFGQTPPPKFSINGGARAVYFADRLSLAGRKRRSKASRISLRERLYTTKAQMRKPAAIAR
jgi:hypothetical protein